MAGITRRELLKNAREKLKDARALHAAGRYETAIYIGGYAVELALKARIVRHLKWPDFPEGKNNPRAQPFLTHDLNYLLWFTGREQRMKKDHLTEWSIVSRWNPESRYQQTTTGERESRLMIESAQTLVNVLAR